MFLFLCKAFINTAKEIYQKIQEGVFDINNEVGYNAYNYHFTIYKLPLINLTVVIIKGVKFSWMGDQYANPMWADTTTSAYYLICVCVGYITCLCQLWCFISLVSGTLVICNLVFMSPPIQWMGPARGMFSGCLPIRVHACGWIHSPTSLLSTL